MKMGTRSLTVFINEYSGDEIVVMYRQMDGYLSGHGTDLARFLAPMEVVNGYQMGDRAGEKANGMGCLAAQVVAAFKDDIGGIYLEAAGTRDVSEEFIYTVYLNGGVVWLKAEDTYEGTVLYDGPASQAEAAFEASELV
jgi:hypothetical protein